MRCCRARAGNGGEQGDPLMPGLYALGQHAALLHLHSQLRPDERLYAFLDDVYVTSTPERTLPALRSAQEVLSQHANVQVHLGKMRAWNAAGEEPPGPVAALPRREGEPPCWTGSWALPPEAQGLVVLGTPIGSREYVARVLEEKRAQQDLLLARLPAVQDLQSAWLLLLFCAAPRCNYLLRTVPPSATTSYAGSHDEAILRCLATLLSGGKYRWTSRLRASGEPTCRCAWAASACRRPGSTGWASWADTVTALQECHLGTLAALMRPLLDVAAAGVPPSVMEAEHAAQCLRSQGYNAPTWAALLEGTVPPNLEDDAGPSAPTRRGWQQSAGAAVDKRALEMLFSDLDSASRALLLSQSGEGASCAITAIPSSPDFVVDSGEFRTFLLRRLRLALPLAPRRCRCGGTLDELGDHRSACAQVGVRAHRAGPLERAAARICREAGARVATSVALRDLNLDVPATDGRRIEVVANGLPLWQGAQIAVDTTLVCPVRRDGQARPGADARPGLALEQAAQRKMRTYPELQPGGRGRCRLVVFGLEVGGRFSSGTLAFIRRLARVRSRVRAPWAQIAAARALTRRWTALAGLAAMRAHAQSLLELPVSTRDAGDGAEILGGSAR